MCDCIERVDADPRMIEGNTRILTNLFGTIVAVSTEKRDSKKHGRPMTLAATFCPFCGQRYQIAKQQNVAIVG